VQVRIVQPLTSPLAMIRACSFSGFLKLILSLTLLCVLGDSEKLYGQFVSVQLELKAELETTILSELNFGNAVINTGEQAILLGDPNMGIFEVKTYNTQMINLSLVAPQHLTHVNPGFSDRIPISIRSSYSNSGINDYRNSVPMQNNEAFIKVNNSPGEDNFSTGSFYIYVFGSVNIGNINQGVYTGEIRLIIDYQ